MYNIRNSPRRGKDDGSSGSRSRRGRALALGGCVAALGRCVSLPSRCGPRASGLFRRQVAFFRQETDVGNG